MEGAALELEKKRKTILIADDDIDVLEAVQIMLMDENFNVITASNGREAVDRFKTKKIDFTFLDLKMPIMDGYDAFFKIKEIDPTSKVAFITAFTIDDSRYEKALKNNLIDTLYKPVTLEKILKTLNENIQVIDT